MSENGPRVLRIDSILRMPTVPSPEYGLRMSVMSRHTLNDGVTPDSRLDGRWDLHRPQLGPPLKLIGAYYRDSNPSWDEFAERYYDHLTGSDKRNAMAEILLLLNSMHVTLLCIEEFPDKCHRRLLAEILECMDETLRVVVC